jgi:RNA binding exosome subunit
MDVQIDKQYASHGNILSRRANFDLIYRLVRVPNYPEAEDASLLIVQGVQHLSRACTPVLDY